MVFVLRSVDLYFSVVILWRGFRDERLVLVFGEIEVGFKRSRVR